MSPGAAWLFRPVPQKDSIYNNDMMGFGGMAESLRRIREGDIWTLGGRAWLGVLLICLSLSACSFDYSESLRVGTNLWVGYEPLYLARSIGALPDNSVRLVELPATTDVIHALRSQTLEAAALTLDEVLSQLADGVDLRVVLVMDYSDGGDVLIGHDTVSRLEELRGHRIGYENSAVGALMLDAALEAGHLTPGDITLVPLTPDQHVAAFLSGRVDAVVTFEPARTQLLEHGATVLFDSSRIPGRIIDVLAVRGDVADTQPKQVQALLDGWFRALAYMQVERSSAVSQMSIRHQITPEIFAVSLSGLRFVGLEENRQLLAALEPGLQQRADALARLMVQRGLLPDVPGLNGVFDSRSLPK